jgi:prophage tail gpP-like protein
LVFANVQGIHVWNTGNGTLVFGGGSNPVFGTDQATVKAGRDWLNMSTFTITTNINLRVTGTSTYKILVYGA